MITVPAREMVWSLPTSPESSGFTILRAGSSTSCFSVQMNILQVQNKVKSTVS